MPCTTLIFYHPFLFVSYDRGRISSKQQQDQRPSATRRPKWHAGITPASASRWSVCRTASPIVRTHPMKVSRIISFVSLLCSAANSRHQRCSHSALVFFFFFASLLLFGGYLLCNSTVTGPNLSGSSRTGRGIVRLCPLCYISIIFSA